MKAVSTTCAVFNEALFETMVKSSWHPNRMSDLPSKDEGIWQMISINVLLTYLSLWKKTTESCSRAHICLSFSLSKKRDPGIAQPATARNACHGSKSGLVTWMISDSFFKLRDSGDPKRDVQLFFDAVFVMTVSTGLQEESGYETFWVLPNSYGKDDEQNRKNSILPATWMLSWYYCVQTRTISVSSMRCMVPCVGKGAKEIVAVSRSWCGMD